ncbi:MAG TPA: hypothetical protein VKB77_14375 [Terriglobales bacterium]|nr:hypothetical protein [Terriglobales bacterium]
MNRRSRVCLALLLTFLPVAAFPQPCPRVSYTISESATLRKLITTVNCLVANSTEKPEKPEKPPAATPESSTPVATGVQVDAVRIIGPQHRGPFRKIIVVILSVPSGDTLKTVLANSESPEATATATAGATCKAKINSDNSVDGQCNLTGGTMYVVYHN